MGKYPLHRFSVAPMLHWTDRHCRFFYRQLTKRALLYSEMIVADAILRGDRKKLLGFSEVEKPLVLQLAGSDPQKLAEAARIGEDFGYDEINLNIGCPSYRVQFGTFGACLMKKPEIVAKTVEAMKAAVCIPVTVKCRLGVDEQDSVIALDKIGYASITQGADAMLIHARKAWLKGLSPKENREIPPLNYQQVYHFKQKYTKTFVVINGGISSFDEAVAHLHHVDGVMLGRSVYYAPRLLAEVDQKFYQTEVVKINYEAIIEIIVSYANHLIAKGGRLSDVTRHMTGLFHGFSGARRWRQILSSETIYNNTSILREAFSAIQF